MNLTLVAFYKEKPREFANLVGELQRRLETLLGDGFIPYPLAQVHSTIIGLEGRRDGGRMLNVNFLSLRRQRRQMEPAQLADAVNRVLQHFPLRLRIGGYRASKDYPFTSLGAHPFLRSFSIRNSIAVAMGWPADGDRFPSTLDRIRREFAKANVLHKYHGSITDVDNDFFFVLGKVDAGRVATQSLESAEHQIRAYLESQEPVHVELLEQHLSIVSYNHPTLELNTSTAYPVKELALPSGRLRDLFATLYNE